MDTPHNTSTLPHYLLPPRRGDIRLTLVVDGRHRTLPSGLLKPATQHPDHDTNLAARGAEIKESEVVGSDNSELDASAAVDAGSAVRHTSELGHAVHHRIPQDITHVVESDADTEAYKSSDTLILWWLSAKLFSDSCRIDKSLDSMYEVQDVVCRLEGTPEDINFEVLGCWVGSARCMSLRHHFARPYRIPLILYSNVSFFTCFFSSQNKKPDSVKCFAGLGTLTLEVSDPLPRRVHQVGA